MHSILSGPTEAVCNREASAIGEVNTVCAIRISTVCNYIYIYIYIVFE